MGDPSALRYVPAKSASTHIDWSKVPEASKEFLLNGWGNDWKTGKRKPLPATIGDLANMLNGSKFFGYMDSQRCTLLLDISEFGLAASVTPGLIGNANAMSVGPRFYMKYLDEVWFVLLIPGKREGAIGFGPTVEPKFDDENEGEVENVKEAGHNDGEEGQNDGEEGEAGDDEDEEEGEDVEYDSDDDYTHTKTEEIAMAQAFDAKLDQERVLGS